MILNLFRRSSTRKAIAALFARVATASREPALYLSLGIPDTVEGRFEALSLHVVLVVRTLRDRAEPAPDIARALIEAYFRDLDSVLRESGVGDTRVPKRMKGLAQAFYGRAQAYDEAFAMHNEAALAAALARNVTAEAPADALARYVLSADRNLRAQDLDDLLARGPAFPRP